MAKLNHFNTARQGHRTRISKELMYEIRYRAEFQGWRSRKIESYYGLDIDYVKLNILEYRTMASVIPVRGKNVPPEV